MQHCNQSQILPVPRVYRSAADIPPLMARNVDKLLEDVSCFVSYSMTDGLRQLVSEIVIVFLLVAMGILEPGESSYLLTQVAALDQLLVLY